MPEQTLSGRLVELRDNYRGEIPDRIIHSDAPDNLFKVRRGWFTSLRIILEESIWRGEIVDPEVRKQVEKFIEFVSDDYGRRMKTTPEDIAYADTVIDLVLKGQHPDTEGASGG